jgi:hypothetical protein
MADRLLYLILGAAAGAWLFQSCAPADVVPYPEVIVPAARIIEREPPARPPTIVERIVYVAPQPTLTARAPSGAVEAVDRFCRPVTLVRTDSVTVVDTVLVIRSGSWNESWWTPRPDELRLTGFTNVGDLEERTYRTRGSFDFIAVDDELVVRYGRFNAIGDWLDFGARAWSLFSIVRAGVEAF